MKVCWSLCGSLSHLAPSRSLARTFKHEPVLLHTGKMHHLLNFYQEHLFSPCSLRGAGKQEKLCVCALLQRLVML